jgi:hypothetical protein
MTVLVHAHKEIIFKVIDEFFQERGILCQPYDPSNKNLNASCLIGNDASKNEYPASISTIILKRNEPIFLLELFQNYQKKYALKNAEVFEIRSYKICPKSRQAICFGKHTSLVLTEKEVLILKALYDAKRPLTKEDLLRYAWGYDNDIDTHTIETHMYRLRKKISPENPDSIIITLKEGYALKS